jgi:hypothetical protein
LIGRFLDFTFSKFSESTKNRIRYSRLNLIWNIYLNFRLKHSTNLFYSQNGEDFAVLKYLPETIGTYIDIGAGWPIRGSNTYYFYKLGWRGVTVDPISQNVFLQRMFRPQDTQVRALLGVTPGFVDFYRFEPYEYSTSNYDVASDIISEKRATLLSIDRFEIKRLDSFKLKALPLEPIFLSIDVEGKDFDVLSSNNWSKFLPRVICIETWSDHSEDEKKINSLLQQKGYILVDSVSLSRIYVHEIFLNRLRRN